MRSRPVVSRLVAIATASLHLGLIGLAAGCATPVGVRAIRPAEAERLLTSNVLSSRSPSAWSAQLVARLGLAARFEKEPAAVLAELHQGLGGVDESPRLFVLAELAFAQADATGDPAWFLASAVYAWAYLFPEDEALAPGRFDPRLRVAMALYNRALARGLVARGDDRLEMGSRDVALPFGSLSIVSPAGELRFGGYRLEQLVSLAAMDVRGLRNHYRRSGIGATVIARCAPTGDAEADRWLTDNPKVPMTVVLRMSDVRASLRSGRVAGEMDVLDPETVESTAIGSQMVPVESDATAAIGYSLEGAPVWDSEIAGFRRGDFTLGGRSAGGHRLFMLHPWIPGRIPVVFVHGTASSPARWAEMLNEVQSDPFLRGRYQYWFFQYNTGNPVPASASYLRESLREVVSDVDPAGRDTALSRMVVIGHSQGGLLTKMTVVDSGQSFWRAISDKPFEEEEMRAETREYLRRTAFVEPLPFVERVVFVATPHGGTVLASNWLGRTVRRFIRLPGSLASIGLDLLRLQVRGALQTAMNQVPTSIDNMSPKDPFLKTLHGLPVTGGVAAHSIIAVQGKGPPEQGSDGVVAWSSAHLEGVTSELVVHSSHSTQGHPATIEEVRRILYEHLSRDLYGAADVGGSTP
ncbi:MAG: esterase/lipase family protein [Candidatus Binatia bacterium]